MKITKYRISAVMLGFALTTIQAQKKSIDNYNNPVTLPLTQQINLTSKGIDDGFKLYVSLPFDYMTGNEKYPVIYVLDGDLTFGHVHNVFGLMSFGKEVPPAILVGIAYQSGLDKMQEKRFRDLTPTTWASYNPNSGGASQFLQFIENQVKPYINQNYRTNEESETLVGLSLAGLFVCNVLIEKPELFDNYLIASPSLWWEEGQIIEKIKDWKYSPNHLMKVYTSIGSEEPYKDMISPWTRFCVRMEDLNFQKIVFKKSILDQESHYTTFGNAFTKGVRFILN